MAIERVARAATPPILYLSTYSRCNIWVVMVMILREKTELSVVESQTKLTETHPGH